MGKTGILKTPAERGYYMPPEWDEHEATWICWPHAAPDWPTDPEPIFATYAEEIRALTESEEVRILVNDEKMEESARGYLVQYDALLPGIQFYHIPTNDAWIRDHGPIFLRNQDPTQPRLILDWKFNSWGEKYPPWDEDDRTPIRIARTLGLEVVHHDMVLEGGGIEVNGRGTLLTTESCLLNPNRNPGMSRDRIEGILRDNFGVRHVLWLASGIEGDDTDGHIDTLCRFVSPTRVVIPHETNVDHPDYEALKVNLDRIRVMKDQDGEPFEVLTLPTAPEVTYQGKRLPSNYANFYIANKIVLVPIYGDEGRDNQALDVLRDCFPTRKIVGIRCNELIRGLGAFHCLTQQQPL